MFRVFTGGIHPIECPKISLECKQITQASAQISGDSVWLFH